MKLSKTRMTVVMAKERVRFWKIFQGRTKKICGRIGCGLKKEKNHSSLSGKLKRQSCFLLDVED